MTRTARGLYVEALDALLRGRMAEVAVARDWELLREVARLAQDDAPLELAATDPALFTTWRDGGHKISSQGLGPHDAATGERRSVKIGSAGAQQIVWGLTVASVPSAPRTPLFTIPNLRGLLPMLKTIGSIRADSFNYLIGAYLNRWGYGKAKRLGGLEVQDHLKFRWKLHREIARPLAAQDAIDISRGTTPDV